MVLLRLSINHLIHHFYAAFMPGRAFQPHPPDNPVHKTRSLNRKRHRQPLDMHWDLFSPEDSERCNPWGRHPGRSHTPYIVFCQKPASPTICVLPFETQVHIDLESLRPGTICRRHRSRYKYPHQSNGSSFFPHILRLLGRSLHTPCTRYTSP